MKILKKYLEFLNEELKHLPPPPDEDTYEIPPLERIKLIRNKKLDQRFYPTDEEIFNDIKNLSIEDRLNLFIFDLDDKFYPTDKEISKLLSKKNPLERLSICKRYSLRKKFYPSIKKLDEEVKKSSLSNIYNNLGGTFGLCEIKVRVKNIRDQLINHTLSKQCAGKEGYLASYLNRSDKGELYVIVKFNEFISDPHLNGGGRFEEYPIMLANLIPIGYTGGTTRI